MATPTKNRPVSIDEFTRRVRIGRRVVTQHLWSIWIDNEDLVCVSQFWLDEHGSHYGRPEVAEMEAEYGSIYSVRRASRGKPA